MKILIYYLMPVLEKDYPGIMRGVIGFYMISYIFLNNLHIEMCSLEKSLLNKLQYKLLKGNKERWERRKKYMRELMKKRNKK